MDRIRDHGDVGDSVTGRIVCCEYRKSDRERLIRRTATHRGRSACLHDATCTVTKAYRQAQPKMSGMPYTYPGGGQLAPADRAPGPARAGGAQKNA